MKEVEYYRGREQTYLKHFFLERYLERVAYIIGWSYPKFVYVDGFSGPWKSDDEAFEDTSFTIAINKLWQVQTNLRKAGKNPQIRCLFVEKDPTAFRQLNGATTAVLDIGAEALQGEFEDRIPDILRFVGSSFSLVFIDPTGWTGFGLRNITSILQHQPGEVLINFMFDHINRFLHDSRPEIVASFDRLFGGPGWESAVRNHQRREDEVVKLYSERMRVTGGFRYMTSTRILKPLADRSYFHLIYGTRNLKGLREFRSVEKVAINEQERVRSRTKQVRRVERTGQSELFADDDIFVNASSFEEQRALQRREATTRLRSLLLDKQRVQYLEVLEALLEVPLVWESVVQEIIRDMRTTNEVKIQGLAPRERTVKVGHFLVSKTNREHGV